MKALLLRFASAKAGRLDYEVSWDTFQNAAKHSIPDVERTGVESIKK